MKYDRWIVSAVLVFSAATCVPAQDAGEAKDVTVITSDHLTFDYTEQYAFFDGNVVVTDPEMKLKADKMRVVFDAESQVESIIAEGHVWISQADKTAESGKAVYEVATGKIILEDNPSVRRGKDLLEGDTITFWRNENKMICEPQARLVIFPAKGGTRDQLFGE